MRRILRLLGWIFALPFSIACIAALGVLIFLFSLKLKFEELIRSGVPDGPGPSICSDGKSMEDISKRLSSIPFKPVKPQAIGFLKGALANNVFLILNAARATAGMMYPYPDNFEEVVIESFDGTPITATVGLHKDGKKRPGLVISHGFMGSKNDHYIVDTAISAFAGWGFNVVCVDLRNFGGSQRLSHSPTTAGWKEAEDLLAAAKYLSEQPDVTSVGITGFSMGAGSTMRAAYAARVYPYLTGGALAWNGYADTRRMVEYISTRPQVSDPFYPIHLVFRLMHKIRREDMKRYITDPEILSYLDKGFDEASFVDYVEKIAAPHYGVTVDEIYANSSPKEFLAEVSVPLLIVHAEDDPICPPSEMEELKSVEEENPFVKIWMLPSGNHCMFRYLDRKWYEEVSRSFFEYWARWE